MYQQIAVGRLYEQIVSQIEERILKGVLRVGDQLPPERDLCEQFGVSRTAVREAVKALREKGLVQTLPGRGTFISNSTSRAVRDSLGLLSKIGHDDPFRDLVQVREILEPDIAALAATNANAEQIGAMSEAVAAMDEALNDADAFIEADLDFHLALAEAAQNEIILTLIDSIVDLLREQRIKIFHTKGGPQRGQFHHKQILDAIKRRDPEAARNEMRAHLSQVRKDSQNKTPSR